MKKLLLFVLLATFNCLYGQNLSLSQLMSLKSASLDEVETFLTTRGWSYKDGIAENENSYGYVNFIYKADNSLKYGDAFLTKFYSTITIPILTLQINKQEVYLSYLSQVKSLKTKLIYSGMYKGNLHKIYQNSSSTFIFKTTTRQNGNGKIIPGWTLTVLGNNYFNLSSYKNY